MGSERLAVDFERRADGGVILRLSGSLERGTAPLLDGVLHALVLDATPVTLDLAEVEHIDARGLDLLLAAEGARDGCPPIEIVGVRESLRDRRSPPD